MKAISTIRRSTVLLLLSGMVFAYLMAIRTGLIHTTSDTPRTLSTDRLEERETWLTIYQDALKIGYTHRKLAHADTGFLLTDYTVMRLNTMGLVQTLEVRTTAKLLSDFSLSSVDFSLRSHRFLFHAVGRVEKDTLTVSVAGRESRIPVDGPLYVTAGALDAVNAATLKPGETVQASVFDPSTLSQRAIRVTAVGREVVQSMGDDIDALKVHVEVMGAVMTAWLDKDGEVLQERGLLGFTLKRVSREEALDGRETGAGPDLTRLVSVGADRTIASPQKLTRLCLAIGGVPPSLFLDGDRQTYQDRELIIRRESLPDPEKITEKTASFSLAATPFIESDHPEILRAVSGIVSPTDRPLEKARKLVAWVYDTIEKRPVLSVPSAVETLRQGQGDCNEHAVLLAALARAAGIPAQVEAGLVYLNGRFYYHAWNALFLGRWITADALMNQLPADVTHVRLVRGEPVGQMDLLGTIGNLSLSIRETTP
jgi:hypothetical protein